MSKEVDAKATSDPYQNNASQAHNTKGATANDTTNDSSNKAASNAPHGGDGHGPSSLGSLTSSMPVSGSMRSMMMPVGAGVLGFGASTIALKSLPPTYPYFFLFLSSLTTFSTPSTGPCCACFIDSADLTVIIKNLSAHLLLNPLSSPLSRAPSLCYSGMERLRRTYHLLASI